MKPIPGNRKEINGYLSSQVKGGAQRERVIKALEKMFGGNWKIHYVNCSDNLRINIFFITNQTIYFK